MKIQTHAHSDIHFTKKREAINLIGIVVVVVVVVVLVPLEL